MNGHSGTAMDGHSGTEINGHSGAEINGHSGAEMNGHSGIRVNGHSKTEMNGHSNTERNGHSGTEMNGHSNTERNGHSGTEMNGHSGAVMNGHSNTERNGHSGTAMNGHSGAVMNGHSGTERNGHSGTEMNGHSNTERNGHSLSEMNGHSNTEMNGLSGTESNGHSNTERNGHSRTVMNGHIRQGTNGHSEGKKTLCVGLVCLDIITVCKDFPEEDTDLRSLNYYWQRGGNAANSSTVLSLLGSDVEFIGTMARDKENTFIRQDFKSCGVCIDHCIEYGEEMCTPTSIVILNSTNGSRTIMHYRKNLPECPYEKFKQLDLSDYKWIHFEGRPSADNIKLMIEHIRRYNNNANEDDRVTISLELEKRNRFQLDSLIPLVDVLMVSKVKAMELGFTSKEETARSLIKQCKQGAIIFCPWGEDGAAAMETEGCVVSSKAFPPDKVVDTLAAGDTFNAAVILSLSQHWDVQNAVTFGCKLAGRKVGERGLSWIKHLQ